MKAKVTKEGLLIPKQMLSGFKEVEIRREDHQVVIIPFAKDDPIFSLGKHPVECGLSDVSEHHDRYLYLK